MSGWSTDRVEQELIATEATVARLRARQAQLLAEIDRRQIPLGDGCRTLVEWTAGRLDVSPETARTLTQLTNTQTDRGALFKRLAAGEWSVDRTIETDRWIEAGIDPDRAVSESTSYDIGGLRHRIALTRRLHRVDEDRVFDSRFLVTQRSLDRTHGRLWGQLAGDDMDQVEHHLTTVADSFPPLPNGTRPTRPQRLADALVALTTGHHPTHHTNSSSDDPDGRTEPPNPTDGTEVAHRPDPTDDSSDAGSADVGTVSRPVGALSVFIDAGAAHTTGGYTIGDTTIDRLLCDAHLEHTALTDRGPVELGGRNTVTDRQRRRVHHHHKTCAADGCQNHYRLQVHHRTHQAHGGDHHDTNLTLLCWWHHHIVIHRYHYTINPHSPPHRLRFTKPPPQLE